MVEVMFKRSGYWFLALSFILLSAPVFSQESPTVPTRPVRPVDPISDDFPAFEEHLIPGIQKDDATVPVEQREELEDSDDTKTSDNADEGGGFLDTIRDIFGSDRTLINVLIFLALIVATLIYRTRSNPGRRSY